MKFELEIDDWIFHLALELTPEYRPNNKFVQTSSSDLQSWREGHLGFYSLIITSSKKDNPDESMIHYVAGVLLPNDPDEIAEDLEVILDDEGLIEHVLNHWKLDEDDQGPSWRQG